MTEYKDLVERCRKLRLDQLITNESPSHAGVLFENMFEAAKAIPSGEPREVRIQCGETLAPVFANLVGSAQAVMGAGVTIKLLIDSHDVLRAGDGFVRAVLSNPQKRGEVRSLGPSADRSSRFITVGNSAYRLETNHETIEASANFKDPIVTQRLAGLFDANWQKSPVVSAVPC